MRNNLRICLDCVFLYDNFILKKTLAYEFPSLRLYGI